MTDYTLVTPIWPMAITVTVTNCCTIGLCFNST
jgi:hypothetical protein